MKKFLFVLFMFSWFWQSNAQEDKERIKALKTAFITQEMKMSNKTAQKFWPVYNEYESRRWKLHEEEKNKLIDSDCINGQEAEKMLSEYLDIERQEYVIKKQYFEDLKKIFSAKDIIKLHRLEDEFHKKLIREYRARKHRERENNK
ncbi:hypothetical protein RM549_10515 [Salegentibacter sp. F188]|uniref:Sensor of ECF-type sigma factor n=1 Tax=Autumnicola patrickiae TaxID=3075591 RepID=A0ABU3E2I9_9FLAO|nr:hypothetical protein [Salegentibacter sp. F188]MDT0690218.1 hypothetical protein [Salegentibacter sp. F188]